jgi:RNA polymerase sigma-70 factor (ECF subfamily)
VSAINYEEQLILAKNGDIQAFEALITNYERLIFSIAFRMLGNREDARDISQEVLIKVYNSLDKCADIQGFKNWICRIATNACIDDLRKRRNRQTVSIDAGFSAAAQSGIADANDESAILDKRAANDPTPESALMQSELSKEIAAAINKLSETHKALVVLRDVKGLSYEEVAEAMEMNMGTVKSGLARARLKLRELLKDIKTC